MDFREIDRVVRRSPFVPFVLRLNDGREYPIPHPEWISVRRRLVTIVSEKDETTTYLEPFFIVSLHFAAPPPPDQPPPTSTEA
jgi:hypothetical protein